MKSVLIVEDEKLIRVGIKTMIQRSGVPVEMILECNNGEIALEILKEQQIDVMFTDIRMPKMDGITLVKRMQECRHIPLTVAVSGYDDFSYAVELMSLGVREYILKPVDRNKIKEVLEKLNKEIEENNKNDDKMREIGYKQLKYLIMSENMKQSELQSFGDQFELGFYNGVYRVCCIGEWSEFEEGENYIYLSGIEDSNVFIVEEHNLNLLLKNELRYQNTGVSGHHAGIQELRAAYEEAMRMRKASFCENIMHVIYGEERQEQTDRFALGEKQSTPESRLQRVQLLGTDKTDEIISAWEFIFREAKRRRILWEAFEENILHYLEETAKTYKNVIGEDMGEIKALKHILRYNNIDLYQDEFMNYTLGLHEKINSQFSVNKNKQKILQAIDYINENYARDLNMAVVSNYISMNYSLFSYSFKQITGSNFINYLKDIRMGEAKRLLKDTELRINEISQEVGYDNEKNFMKIFKSTCGVSPSEYRKNMQLSEPGQ